MLAGNEREALLAVADQLSEELGHSGDDDPTATTDNPRTKGEASGGLGPEDEALILGMRQGLAKIASALAGRSLQDLGDSMDAALDGAEIIIRGELRRGNAERLLTLTPSFVFLVALAVVDQEQALAASERSAELVAAVTK